MPKRPKAKTSSPVLLLKEEYHGKSRSLTHTQLWSRAQSFCLGEVVGHKTRDPRALPKELTLFETMYKKVKARKYSQKQWM